MNKLIETVTFCKRIGGLVIGFDLVKQAMQKGETGLVLLAKDLSPKTEKEIWAFLGRLQYISRFIAQLTPICEPILKLLRKKTPPFRKDRQKERGLPKGV